MGRGPAGGRTGKPRAFSPGRPQVCSHEDNGPQTQTEACWLGPSIRDSFSFFKKIKHNCVQQFFFEHQLLGVREVRGSQMAGMYP